MGSRSTLRSLFTWFPAVLSRFGIVDRAMGEKAFDLAAPAMVTGAFRILIRMSDFVFVGLALGNAGLAALELGFQFYFIPVSLSLALTSGTISVVSRYTGAEKYDEADTAVKQSLWLSLLVSIPFMIVSWLYAPQLIGLLSDDPRTIALGAAYLQIVILGIVPTFWGMIASRALAGTGDTRTPMYVRLATLPMDIGLSVVLIFGVGPFPRLGIVGAAIGTLTANVLSALIFFALFVSGRRSIRLRLSGSQLDWTVMREIVRVALPLTGTRLSRTLSRFPFLFILSVFGTGTIAAYAIGRRVILLAMMPAWGYSTAASTLVGQHLGHGEDDRAAEYGWQTTRIALATQLLIAVGLVITARPIALVFGTESVDLTVAFIRIFGLGVAGFSISRTMRGGLRGAGDTRWPLYGTLAGSYLFKLPIAILALPVSYAFVFGPLSLGPIALEKIVLSPGLGLGYTAIFAAILADIYVKAVVNATRFYTGAWKEVARRSGMRTPDVGD
jgi:putative MATE family efflux protein